MDSALEFSPHCRSRLSDHMLSLPSVVCKAKVLIFCASSSVRYSLSVSFFPMRTVAPSICQICELLNSLRFVIEDVLYLVIVTTLIFSAMVYLVTRQGAMYRFRTHERVPRAVLDEHFAHGYNKGITVLIPSYVEQPKVVAKTIWSAALQEFPDLAIVLLIDDPPHPKNNEARRILEASRALMPEILDELAQPAGWMQKPTTGPSMTIPTSSSVTKCCVDLPETCGKPKPH